jgi:hypothetical protein
LGRRLHEKMAKERIRKESNPTEVELIESLFITRSSLSVGHNRSRSLSFNDSDDSIDNPFERRRSRRRMPVVESDADEDAVPSAQISKTVSHTSSTLGHVAQRPKLETIPSTDGSGNPRTLSKKSKRPKSTRTKTNVWVDSPVGDDTE